MVHRYEVGRFVHQGRNLLEKLIYRLNKPHRFYYFAGSTSAATKTFTDTLS